MKLEMGMWNEEPLRTVLSEELWVLSCFKQYRDVGQRLGAELRALAEQEKRHEFPID